MSPPRRTGGNPRPADDPQSWLGAFASGTARVSPTVACPARGKLAEPLWMPRPVLNGGEQCCPRASQRELSLRPAPGRRATGQVSSLLPSPRLWICMGPSQKRSTNQKRGFADSGQSPPSRNLDFRGRLLAAVRGWRGITAASAVVHANAARRRRDATWRLHELRRGFARPRPGQARRQGHRLRRPDRHEGRPQVRDFGESDDVSRLRTEGGFERGSRRAPLAAVLVRARGGIPTRSDPDAPRAAGPSFPRAPPRPLRQKNKHDALDRRTNPLTAPPSPLVRAGARSRSSPRDPSPASRATPPRAVATPAPVALPEDRPVVASPRRRPALHGGP